MSEEPKKLDEQLDAMVGQAADAPAAGAPTNAPEGGDEAQLVEQIDAMLASGAEEAVSEDLEAPETAKEVEPAAQAAVAPVEATAATVEADDLEGEFQSMEELTADDPAAAVAQKSGGAGDAMQEAGSAEAVATELDAVEQQGAGNVEQLPDAHDDDLPTFAEFEPVVYTPSPMVRVMAVVNKPVMGWPAFRRDMFGMIGLESGLIGLCLLVNVLFGGTATWAAVIGSCVVVVAMFYMVFVKEWGLRPEDDIMLDPAVDAIAGAGDAPPAAAGPAA